MQIILHTYILVTDYVWLEVESSIVGQILQRKLYRYNSLDLEYMMKPCLKKLFLLRMQISEVSHQFKMYLAQ